jgi:hypothetical protein
MTIIGHGRQSVGAYDDAIVLHAARRRPDVGADTGELPLQARRRRQHDRLAAAPLLGRNLRNRLPQQKFIADAEIADAIGGDDHHRPAFGGEHPDQPAGDQAEHRDAGIADRRVVVAEAVPPVDGKAGAEQGHRKARRDQQPQIRRAWVDFEIVGRVDTYGRHD